MTIIYKRKKEPEVTAQCEYCKTIFKFSWLDKLDGLCPFCWKDLDLDNALTISLPKYKTYSKLPAIIKLKLSVNRLEAELKEKYIKQFTDQSLKEFEKQDPQIDKINQKLEKLNLSINKLKKYAKEHKLHINDIYKWNETN